jgi:hypothetical protein
MIFKKWLGLCKLKHKIEVKAKPRNPFGSRPPPLRGAKVIPRIRALEALPDHDVIVELYAGRGYLSCIYADFCNVLVLVDNEKTVYNNYARRIWNKRAEVDIYCMNNELWIEKHLDKYRGRITLVDFDPYGSPLPVMRLFFERYGEFERLAVAFTDGILGYPINPLSFVKYGERPRSADELIDLWRDKIGLEIMEKTGARIRWLDLRRAGKIVYGAFLLERDTAPISAPDNRASSPGEAQHTA